jgi:hypothetical protein
VTPRSRRWEKKRRVARGAQAAVVDSVTPAACRRGAGDGLEVERALAVPKTARTSSPTS